MPRVRIGTRSAFVFFMALSVHPETRVEESMPNYPFIENTQMDILCYIHDPWMSIRIFLNERIFRHCMDFNPGNSN